MKPTATFEQHIRAIADLERQLEEAQKIVDILRPTMNLGVVQAPTPIEDIDRLFALKDAVAAFDRILRGSKEDE